MLLAATARPRLRECRVRCSAGRLLSLSPSDEPGRDVVAASRSGGMASESTSRTTCGSHGLPRCVDTDLPPRDPLREHDPDAFTETHAPPAWAREAAWSSTGQ